MIRNEVNLPTPNDVTKLETENIDMRVYINVLERNISTLMQQNLQLQKVTELANLSMQEQANQIAQLNEQIASFLQQTNEKIQIPMNELG